MKCENCNIEHSGEYGTGRFCGVKCARGFSTKAKRDQINKAVSLKQTGRKLSEEHKGNINRNRKYKEKVIWHCIRCNKEMQTILSKKGRYCSRRCWINYEDSVKGQFEEYRQKCKFTFDVKEFPGRFDLALLEQLGWYGPTNKRNNLTGVSKDHMVSVKDGFIKNIDPSIISHPANCALLPHKKNQSKGSKSSIQLDELLERIRCW